VHRTEGANNLNNLYTEGPPATTITQEAMNAIQEEIANVIEQAGITLKTKSTDTRDQLWAAIQTLGRPYDLVVSSQATFNSMIERVAANQYKIKDEYESVYLKNITGGYACSGAESFLSGGDSWGYIETNNCNLLKAEPDASLNFAGTQGYLDINNDKSSIIDLEIIGDTSTAAGIIRSFYINNDNISLYNCKVRNRKSNYAGRSIGFDCNSSYKDNVKLIGCLVDGFQGTGASITHLVGYYNCNNLTNCYAIDMDSDSSTNSGEIIGFESCENLNGCRAYDIVMDSTNNAVKAYGFSSCKFLSSCDAKEIDISASSGIGNLWSAGYYSCNFLSSCDAITIKSTDAGVSGDGFRSCSQITSCRSISCHEEGFVFCNYISSTSSANSVNADGFSNCNVIIGSISSSNSVNGFNSCNSVGHCRSAGNGTNYNNTFADWGGTVAVADTAAGGWNG
jgi:hypothetical protein